jgi:signal transduction histidine kinase
VLITAVAAAAVVTVIGLALGSGWLTFGGLAVAIVAAAFLALHLIVSERRRHELAEGELSAEATFLESLVESMAAIAGTSDADRILEQTCQEAKRLFDCDAQFLESGAPAAEAPGESVLLMPLRVRNRELGTLRLSRSRPFARGDEVRATLLGDFAAGARENARLLAEATERETDRARLTDQLITAEADERRRLALFLHDGPVQSMAGIGLMLDAVTDSIDGERLDDAKRVLESALARHRETIRSLRDLSFNIEPVVLRDQGFGSAMRAFADQVGLSNQIQIELDVDAAEDLTEKAQVALYQIIREAVNGAIRRGPPTRIWIRVEADGGSEIAMEVSDDGAGERRRASFDAIEDRARTLNGRLSVEPSEGGGTAVRVVLPGYAARS